MFPNRDAPTAKGVKSINYIKLLSIRNLRNDKHPRGDADMIGSSRDSGAKRNPSLGKR